MNVSISDASNGFGRMAAETLAADGYTIAISPM